MPEIKTGWLPNIFGIIFISLGILVFIASLKTLSGWELVDLVMTQKTYPTPLQATIIIIIGSIFLIIGIIILIKYPNSYIDLKGPY